MTFCSVTKNKYNFYTEKVTHYSQYSSNNVLFYSYLSNYMGLYGLVYFESIFCLLYPPLVKTNGASKLQLVLPVSSDVG